MSYSNPKVPFKEARGAFTGSAVPRVALAGIVLGTVATFAFAAFTRVTEVVDPAMAVHGSQQLVMPWHDDAGNVADFKSKYRYREANGHMMDAHPAMSTQEVTVPKVLPKAPSNKHLTDFRE